VAQEDVFFGIHQADLVDDGPEWRKVGEGVVDKHGFLLVARRPVRPVDVGDCVKVDRPVAVQQVPHLDDVRVGAVVVEDLAPPAAHEQVVQRVGGAHGPDAGEEVRGGGRRSVDERLFEIGCRGKRREKPKGVRGEGIAWRASYAHTLSLSSLSLKVMEEREGAEKDAGWGLAGAKGGWMDRWMDGWEMEKKRPPLEIKLSPTHPADAEVVPRLARGNSGIELGFLRWHDGVAVVREDGGQLLMMKGRVRVL
jgi:hypothetical protein